MVRCRGRGSDGLTSGDHEGMGLWPDFLFGGVPGRALLRPACGLVLLGAGAGCVGQLPLEEMPAHATAAAHQGVDWSRAKPARIIVTEFIFAHGEPSFKKGVPYRLELRNTGEEAHMFEARAFFRSIAVRDVEIVETASIGGLKDPNRAWKPAPERLPEVGPEEEDEAEGKDGKAKDGDAKDSDALSLEIDDDDLKEDDAEATGAAKSKDDGAALKIDDDDLKEDEAADKDDEAKDDDTLALEIKEEDEDTLKVDDEGQGEDNGQDTLKIDDEDGDEADEGEGGDDVALKDDDEALKVDDDEVESEEGVKDDDALVLKIDEDETEADAKDDDALALKIDDDEVESDEGAKDDDALALKTDEDQAEAGGTQVAKAAPVIKLPSQGAFDDDDDLTFERTPSRASDLGPVAKDEEKKEDGEKGEEAREEKAAAPQPPQPWTAITVEYIVVPSGHSAFVSFVPVREGTYWLSSGNPVFLTQGMFDRLVIE